MTCDEYMHECRLRWRREYLRDALDNWHDFEELKPDLIEALRKFNRDCWQEDLSGKCHNPNGTLTSFLWNLQSAWQPDKSRLDPFLDFEDECQKVFLRRGLIAYCKGLLRDIEKEAEQEGKTQPGQFEFKL